MRYLIAIIIFTFPIISQAGEREDAIKGVQKAILAYPEVKKAKKQLEKKLIGYIPVDKETTGIIGGVALSASQGYIDTKVIKKMNIKVYGANMRPNIRYNFNNGETKGTVDLGWSF